MMCYTRLNRDWFIGQVSSLRRDELLGLVITLGDAAWKHASCCGDKGEDGGLMPWYRQRESSTAMLLGVLSNPRKYVKLG